MEKIQENKDFNRCILYFLQEIEAKNYSYKSIAFKCQMSLSTLYRKVKQVTGLTPANFVNYLKIQRACQILESSEKKNLNLRQLAFELNYTDAAYFSRVFKNFVGVSPSNFKDSTQKDHFYRKFKANINNGELKHH